MKKRFYKESTWDYYIRFKKAEKRDRGLPAVKPLMKGNHFICMRCNKDLGEEKAMWTNTYYFKPTRKHLCFECYCLGLQWFVDMGNKK